jgi:hypothetical protein
MQRPCAYCKENGHHIRDCTILAAKNSRMGKQPTSMPCIQMPKCVAPKLASKNMYANLCDSSDDEVEEGEILEDRESRPTRFVVVTDSSDDSSCEPIQRTDTTNCNKWARSGIRGVQIARVQTVAVVSESDDEVEGHEVDYEALAASMAEMSAYFAKFRGRSWADIEYDSDLDLE